jgi:ribonuclease P protein component
VTPDQSRSTSDQRLPRARILKDADRIGALLARGGRRHGALISLYFAPSERPRAAFLVPKRYGKAVTRNLQKRRLRELYRLNRDSFPAGKDLVFLLRAPKKGRPESIAPWQALRDDIHGLIASKPHRTNADSRLSTTDKPSVSG